MNKQQFEFARVTALFNPSPFTAYELQFFPWMQSGDSLAERLKRQLTCADLGKSLPNINANLTQEITRLEQGLLLPGVNPIEYVDYERTISAAVVGGTKGVFSFMEYEDYDDAYSYTLVAQVQLDNDGHPDILTAEFQPIIGKNYLAILAGLDFNVSMEFTRVSKVTPAFLDNFPECDFSPIKGDNVFSVVEEEDRKNGNYSMALDSATVLANNTFSSPHFNFLKEK